MFVGVSPNSFSFDSFLYKQRAFRVVKSSASVELRLSPGRVSKQFHLLFASVFQPTSALFCLLNSLMFQTFNSLQMFGIY